MKLLNKNNINTPEHYDDLFSRRKFEVAFDISRVVLRARCLMEKFTGGRFLDMGCGLSPCSNMAKEKGEAHALDFSEKLIEALSTKYIDIHYKVGDVRNTPYEDNFFDYIVLSEVLEHIEDSHGILREAVRVLKKGGILAVSVPFNDNGKFSPVEHFWAFERGDIKDLLGVYGVSEEKIINSTYIIGYLWK